MDDVTRRQAIKMAATTGAVAAGAVALGAGPAQAQEAEKGKTQRKVNNDTKPQDLQSRDLAKQALTKLLDDPELNYHALLEHLTNNFCQVRVRNDMDTTIFVSVSKTAGQGQDGPWQINPRGDTETWSRYFFYQVTIRASHFFGGPEFDHVTVSLNPGTNSFRVEADRIIGI